MHKHNKYKYLTSLASNLHFPMSRLTIQISSTFASSSFLLLAASSESLATLVLVCNNLLFVALKKAALCLSVGMTSICVMFVLLTITGYHTLDTIIVCSRGVVEV